jgi:competence protein ComEA
VVATLLTIQCLGSTRDSARPADREPARVDLNRATLAELQQLPGIGPKLAVRIEEYRRTRGPFRKVEDLRKVTGIGAKKLEQLRPYVTITPNEDDPEEEAEQPEPPAKPPRKSPKSAPAAKAAKMGLSKKELALQGVVIDVGRASLKDLMRLHGIGLKKAQNIIEERARKPFKTVEDLRRVPGIGPTTLDRLRPYITVGGKGEPVVSRKP